MSAKAAKKGKPRGKPFKGKDDPRIWKGGARSQDAQSFALRFMNALSTGGDPKDISDILWAEAKRRRPWAIEMLIDRLIGKPRENEGQPVNYIITYEDKP